jgi:hypothetical protein
MEGGLGGKGVGGVELNFVVIEIFCGLDYYFLLEVVVLDFFLFRKGELFFVVFAEIRVRGVYLVRGLELGLFFQSFYGDYYFDFGF